MGNVHEQLPLILGYAEDVHQLLGPIFDLFSSLSLIEGHSEYHDLYTRACWHSHFVAVLLKKKPGGHFIM